MIVCIETDHDPSDEDTSLEKRGNVASSQRCKEILKTSKIFDTKMINDTEELN